VHGSAVLHLRAELRDLAARGAFSPARGRKPVQRARR
jgi:hypothetical protein